MGGPRTGRVIGAAAALAAVVALVGGVAGAGEAGTNPLVVVPAAVAACCWIARMALWSLVWHPPRRATAAPAVRAIAERALTVTEVAVICDGESIVFARTSAIAAIAALGDPARVLLVGPDPRLDGLAGSLGVRRVVCGAGEWTGAVAALRAASRRYLVLTSASRVLLPGALRPALEGFLVGGGDGSPGDAVASRVAWVQAEAIPPGERSVVEHVRHRHLWPALDARGAMPLLGLDAVVDVELAAGLPVAEGPAALTVAAQRLGLQGRRASGMLCVEQADRRRDRRTETAARAGRLRLAVSRRAPWWARGLRPWQRLGHAVVAFEDLVGVAATAAVVAVAAVLIDESSPVGRFPLVAALAAVLIGWAARLLLTRGLVRPVAMVRAATDDIAVALAAPTAIIRGRARTDEPRSAVGRFPLVALVALVDVALAVRAVSLIRDGRTPTAAEAAELAAGSIAMVSLLASARVLRRNRTLRAGRRLPVSIVCSIGSWRGRVVELGATGLRAEFAAPAELLAEVPLRLQAPGTPASDVWVQVVRVEPRGDRWELGLRLAGGGAAGAHDDYLALWLSQMAGAAEERPRRVAEPAVGRLPVRAGGAPLLRVASAAAMVAVAVAVLPTGTPAAAGGAPHALPTTAAPAAVATTGPTISAPTLSAPTASVDVAGAGGSPGTTVVVTGGAGGDGPGTAGDGGFVAPAPVPHDGPSAVGDLVVQMDVDDADRVVEGGQLLGYRADLRAAGTRSVAIADVVVTTGVGSIEPGSLGGTCVGATAGVLDAPSTPETVEQPAGEEPADDEPAADEPVGATTARWVLFADDALAPGAVCSLTWNVRLPAATAVQDGSTVRATLEIPSYSVEDDDDVRRGPTGRHEVRLHRPTLRVQLQAGRSDADRVTIGAPATWVVRVENVSPQASTAHGIDLVQTLPAHWTYTSTVAVQPARCDTAPVVLTDATTSVQTVALTDACDLAAGEELVVTLAATPTELVTSDPGLVTGTARPAAQASEVRMTAEDAGGSTLGSASARATALLRTVDLVVRLTDAGRDDAPAEQSPALVDGGLARYRVDVANDGVDPTSGAVDVTLDLPAGMVPLSAAGDGWSCTTAVPVTCTRAAPIAAATATAPIIVGLAVGDLTPDGTSSTVVTATASVRGVDVDADPDDDIDAETSLVRPPAPADVTGAGADLAVTAFTSARRVAVGDEVEVEVVVTGQGPLTDPGPIRVEGEVTPGFDLRAAAGDGWSCDLGPRGGSGFACRIDGPVTDGLALPVLVLTAVVAPEAVSHLSPSAQRTVQLDAAVAGTTAAGRDGAATRLVWDVAPRAELSLALRTADDTAAPSRVGVPGEVEFIVANAGPNGEYGPVTVEVPVPSGVGVVDAGGPGWTCRGLGPDASTVSCTAGRNGTGYGEAAIPAGDESDPLRVVLTATEAGPVRLAATVTGATDDVARSSTLELEIAPHVARSLRLSAPDEAAAGEPVEVTLSLGNAGSSPTATGPEVGLELPAAWRLVAIDDPTWTCLVTGGSTGASADCARPSPLLPDEVDDLVLLFAVDAGATSGDVGVAAALAVDPFEADPLDDVDSIEVWVRGAATDTEASAPTTTAPREPAGGQGSANRIPTRHHLAADLGRLAGVGGSVGALALALVLLSGRRRPGW